MTSEARISANRNNAARSTGPRTARGKARSRGNARRHGLSSTKLRDPKVAAEIARMAEVMRGTFGWETAEQIAECDFIIGQARAARMKAIAQAAAALAAAGVDGDRTVGQRHEQGANQGGIEAPNSTLEMRMANIAHLGHVLSGIERLDRYERRALARRRRAMRALMGPRDANVSSLGPQKAGS